MHMKALLTTSALLLLLLPAATSVVDQSTCTVIWLFKRPCTEPVRALVNQVKAWSTRQCYDSQEKCMYEMIKKLPTHLEIKHTSRKSHKTTQMTLDFNPPAAPTFCRLRAISTTPLNNRLNDTSPNDYCPLYNLISGSGLTQADGYKEICNSAMCPSKESGTCITKG